MTRLKIRTRLLLALAIPLLALGGLGVRYLTTIGEVKVDGHLYTEVTGPRAVEADVALLAENQSRALIDAQQLLGQHTPTRIQGLLADLRIRENYFLDSAEAWDGARGAAQPEMAALIEQAYDPSVEFYRVIDEELVPAVEAEDDAAVESAVAEVGRAYAFSRAEADTTIASAQDQAQASEAAAAAYLDHRLTQDQRVAGALVALALALGLLAVRSITRPLRRLERDLPTIADDLRRMDLAVERPDTEHLTTDDAHDELAQATRAFTSVVDVSVDLAVEQARVRMNQADTLQHLGRRNQNLLRRMMSIISDLENGERDADALQELFRLDHIATRMRRNAESLLVLAGSEPPRRWSEPVPVTDVIRSAASEIEDYDRIDLSNLEPVVVQGSSAADISHLLAELLENATLYSPPQTRVMVSGRRVRAGYQIAVIDQGLGLDADSLARANDRILDAAASAADLTDSKLLGLHVVGRLADRHDTQVTLTPNPAGGLVAIVTLPRAIVALAPSSAGVIPQSGGPVPASAAPAPAPDRPGDGPAPLSRPVVVPVPAVASNGNGHGIDIGNGNGNGIDIGNGNGIDIGNGASPPAPTIVPDEDVISSLRRRVRSADGDREPSVAPVVVHGPARAAEEVRDSWSRLAIGVEQARQETRSNQEETTP